MSNFLLLSVVIVLDEHGDSYVDTKLPFYSMLDRDHVHTSVNFSLILLLVQSSIIVSVFFLYHKMCHCHVCRQRFINP